MTDRNDYRTHQAMAIHRDLDKACEALLRQLLTESVDRWHDVNASISLVLAAKAIDRDHHRTQSLMQYMMRQLRNTMGRDDPWLSERAGAWTRRRITQPRTFRPGHPVSRGLPGSITDLTCRAPQSGIARTV